MENNKVKDETSALLEKLTYLTESIENKNSKDFDEKDKEILYRVIRLMEFFDSFGIFGHYLLKILLWGTAMVGVFYTYQNIFKGIKI